MTQLLRKAIAQMENLPETEQDAIAALVLEELADEARWQEAFSRSQDQLAAMAAKVRNDIHDGKVRKAGWDEL